ncbi:MAG: sortase, partial [Chloroflexi bacterium]|nr:sortase [Chloroflexota bacterium]
SYLVTNSGNVTLSGPFTVADDRAADEACPATASLAPGDSITCGASYTITQADLNAGSVTNIASASGSFGGSPVTSPTDTETVTAVQSPALTLLKSITAGSPYDSVGDIVNYAFLVTNSGNISLAGPVTVADNRATDESCPSVNTVGNLDAFLDPGEAITCIASYTVTQTDLNVGSVTNTASASADGTTSNSDSETAVATQTPSIGLVKEVSVDGGLSWVDANTPPGPSLSSGTDPQFRFTVTNLGNVTLTGLTLIDSDFSTASCTIPASLAPGASFSCTLTAAWASGPHTNTATAAGRLGAVVASDSDDANYTGAAAAISDPAVTKTGDPATAVVGDIVTFTVVVTNAGTANADNVVLTDPVPAFLNIVNVAVAPLGPTPSIVGNTITVPFGTLTPGQTFTVTITTVVNSLGTPPGGTNSATVSTTSAESDPGNNASSALTTIVAATGFGAPATGFAPDRVSRMPAQPDNKRYLDLGDLWLEIPALGLELPIVGVPITDEGWDVTWLGRQAGWLNGTAFPTWEGNSVLTAHVTMASGRAGPFRALKNLRWDDSIIIHYAGQRYVYSVRRAASVSPTDPLITRHEERAWLTLVTCQDYDDGTGEYLRRTIVRAVLTAIEPEP